jgi:phospholipid/cholesterol/gamma-HCH transport system substrate-binding protein
MIKQPINNIKLGAFVLSGLVFIILLLYLIGKNQHLFGTSFHLKVRVDNVQGLKPGNNVRFAGMDVGTVKKIHIINDSVIEIDMVIEEEVQSVIRKNAMVSIKTDGLVGNKVIEITSAKLSAPTVENGDMLTPKKLIDTDEMLRTLNKTNNDLAIITENLKITVTRINNSKAVWNLLNDASIPQNLNQSLANIRKVTQTAGFMANDLQLMVSGVKSGKGSLGKIITDTVIAANINQTIVSIQTISKHADTLVKQLHATVADVQNNLNNGPGTVNALLKDSSLTNKLQLSLLNIQKGTDGFNQNMEALKHNFLFRGYFKRLEKEKSKASGKTQIN